MALKKHFLPLLLFISVSDCGVVNSKVERIIEAGEQCLRISDPLIKNPDYFIPLKTQDIRDMCKIYNEAVVCFMDMGSSYLTSAQQLKLEATINSSLQSSAPLCKEGPIYQREYLSIAPCMKRIFMDSKYCGNHYHHLNDLLKGQFLGDIFKGEKTKINQFCCINHKYYGCLMNMRQECDHVVVAASSQNTASVFMGSLLDQVFNFNLKWCTKYLPKADDCPLDSSNLIDGNTGTGHQPENYSN